MGIGFPLYLMEALALNDKVLLVGRGPSWTECPFDGEVWATATCFLVDELKDKKFTKAFEVNGIENSEIAISISAARERGIPVISPQPYADEKYPHRAITKEFHNVYLKHTIPYMMAYAIYKGYKTIGLYGIDQGPAWHLVSGKPYVTFWLGIAIGRGVAIEMGRSSLRWVYGTGENDVPRPFEVKESHLFQ